MEIIYRANDGKEFDDEYDCEKYERSLKEKELINSGIIFLDGYDELIDNPIYDDDKIYHIFFSTNESIEVFNKIYEEERSGDMVEKLNRYEEIVPNRWYHYDDCEDIYFSYEHKIKENQERIKEYDTLLGNIKRGEK